MTSRWLACALVVIGGCRREHDPAVTAVSPRSASTAAVPAPRANDANDPAPSPAAPPPGSDALVPVPAAIASKVALREVVRGLARPVALVAAPGDARRRLFVVEQHAGRIRVLENGKLADKPFLVVDGDLSRGEEEGLLGLAFHPDFARNGKLYVDYTAADRDTHIVEFRVTRDPDRVDPSTRRELIEIHQPYSNHNGGNLVFGPDGKLYTGMGDGGSAGDPHRNGQNPRALLGKILRFDVDAPSERGRAPAPEIVHVGVRNPWRFSFDVPSGAMYIGDVGQNLWEYVWVTPLASKRNFGWNVVEGSHCFASKPRGARVPLGDAAETCNRDGFTPPAIEYSHQEGCSITGGFVYRGKALPDLIGRYFYTDYCTGLLRSFVWTNNPDSSSLTTGWVREHWDWKAAIDNHGDLSQISSFGIDHDGELYLVKLTGQVYKLVPSS